MITLSILFVSILMAFAVTRDYKIGPCFRDELAQRIKLLRLEKMLTKINIKLKHYLHSMPVTKIENQIRSCESCPETSQCDHVLKQSAPDDLSFCPAFKALSQLSPKLLH